MYGIKVDDIITQSVGIFQRFRMWRIEEECSGFSRISCKLTYLIFHASFVLSFVVGGLLSDNRNEFIFLVSMGVAVAVETVKLIYILWKRDEIHSLILDIGAHSVDDYEEFKKVNEKVKKFRKFTYSLFFIMCAGLVVIFVFRLPIFSNKKQLPFNIWFPLDWKNNLINYWIAYVYMAIASGISFVATFLNILIWYLMMNCATKFQILGNQFRNVFFKKPKTKSTIKKRKVSKFEEDNIFLQQLIALIKSHRNITETIDRFKSCFGNLFFIQITTSGICICGSVYALTFDTHQASLIQFIFYFVFIIHNIFDIFMVMYFGNEIMISSDRLSYCVFESNWIEQSVACKKCIIILMEVLKQPYELVIMKLYPLNMETFSSIVNLAYSMFNILQNLK